MKLEELNELLNKQEVISWKVDDDGMVFRHEHYDKDGEATKLTWAKIKEINPEQLLPILVNGRNVDHITRVTGYMSKVSGWNKGKTGEFKDRYRSGLEENA